ncbi:hypothetical protein L484_016321 [Morus notabilis]|uniref:Transcription repressor n=1 Tax=Morus notabilis TaxID=981085 RepID=W9RH46_9ROSA|nr:transcription repressor OFP6 [Morus notabilis]EXB91250.1 hypothetical protein L484_016321 [Morus notabilis]
MSSNRSKKLLKTIFKANGGNCGCGKPKLSDVFEPTPKPKTSIHQNPTDLPADSSSSSSCLGRNDGISTTDDTATELSISSSMTPHSLPSSDVALEKKIPNKKSINDSCIAVVKDSDDPFEDFKQSMKQMIFEKEIYAKKDLQELLRCFLELNSPSHREIIVRAFTEIWNDVVSKRLSKKSTGDHDHESLDCRCSTRAKAM